MKGIRVLPVGSIDPGTLSAIAHALEKTFRVPAGTGPEIPVPEHSFISERDQYHAAMILREIEDYKEKNSLVLGVTGGDMYAAELNFVFGEADVSNGVAVISLARLRQEFYGLRPDEEMLKERAVKEAIHEIGHVCGLEHCTDRKCIMYFSRTIRDTDRKGPGFCRRCGSALGIRS